MLNVVESAVVPSACLIDGDGVCQLGKEERGRQGGREGRTYGTSWTHVTVTTGRIIAFDIVL